MGPDDKVLTPPVHSSSTANIDVRGLNMGRAPQRRTTNKEPTKADPVSPEPVPPENRRCIQTDTNSSPGKGVRYPPSPPPYRKNRPPESGQDCLRPSQERDR